MTEDQFKAQLASIHATERRIAAEEAAIERQLAIAWFLTHPKEANRRFEDLL